jgi:hypothetical protein
MNKPASEKQIAFLKELLEKRLEQHAVALKAELKALETGGSYAFNFKTARYDLEKHYPFAHEFVVFSISILPTLSSEQASKMIGVVKARESYRYGIFTLAKELANVMPKASMRQHVDQQVTAGKIKAETYEIVCEALADGADFSLLLDIVQASEES